MTYRTKTYLIGAALLAVILFAVYGTIQVSWVDGQCIEAGYAQGHAMIGAPDYCSTRVNNTDLVVTLDYARSHPRTP